MSSSTTIQQLLVCRYRVLNGYKQLVRARNNLMIGDNFAIQTTRIAIKEEFYKHQHINPLTKPQEFEILLNNINDGIKIMTDGMIRGKLNNDSGRYQVKVKKEHTDPKSITKIETVPSDVSITDNDDPMVVTTTSFCQSTKKKDN